MEDQIIYDATILIQADINRKVKGGEPNNIIVGAD